MPPGSTSARQAARSLGAASVRFFFQQGWENWKSAPLRTLNLLARKAYWFLTGHNYGEIYWPTLEQSNGLLTRLRLTPLGTAWLLPLALVTIVVWARRPLLHLPELVLFAVPLLTVVVFFYSPRYRLPAVPVLVVAAAGAVWHAAHWRTRRGWSVAAVLAIGAALGLAVLNRVVDFDQPQVALFHDRLGSALQHQGRSAQALEHFQVAVQLSPNHAILQANLASGLLRSGDTAGALQHFQRALELDPTLLDPYKQVAQMLHDRGDMTGAIAGLRCAHELDPEDVDVNNNLAWYLATTPGLPPQDRAAAVPLAQQAATSTGHQDAGVLDTLAAALAATGDFPGAIATLEQALALAEQRGLSGLNQELHERLALYQAGKPYVATVSPAHP
jgi:Flp pilus assembly protein TadD